MAPASVLVASSFFGSRSVLPRLATCALLTTVPACDGAFTRMAMTCSPGVSCSAEQVTVDLTGCSSPARRGRADECHAGWEGVSDHDAERVVVGQIVGDHFVGDRLPGSDERRSANTDSFMSTRRWACAAVEMNSSAISDALIRRFAAPSRPPAAGRGDLLHRSYPHHTALTASG